MATKSFHMTPTAFRVLIVLYAFLSLAGALAGLLGFGGAVSPLLRAAYDSEPVPLDAFPWWPMAGLMAGLMVTVTVATIGLYTFKPWARTLNLWLTFLSLPFLLLAGPVLETPLESVCGVMSSVLFGAVMALAYYSPLSAHFEDEMQRKATSSPVAWQG